MERSSWGWGREPRDQSQRQRLLKPSSPASPFDRTHGDRVDHHLDVADALGGELRQLLAEFLRSDRFNLLLGASATRHLAAADLNKDGDRSLQRDRVPTDL